MHRLPVFFVAILFCLVAIAKDSDHAAAYRLDKSFLESWEALDREGENDPSSTLQRAITLRDQLGDNPRQQAYADLVIVSLMLKLERATEVLPEIERYLTLTLEWPEQVYQGRFLAYKTEALKGLGKYDEALSVNSKAMLVFQSVKISEYIAGTHVARGQVFNSKAMSASALVELLTALDYYQKLGEPTSLGATYSSIATIYAQTSQSEKAIEFYLKALEYINVDEQAFYASILYFNIGTAYSENEDTWDNAQSYLQRSKSLSVSLKDTIGIAYADARLGQLAVRQQRYTGAEPLLRSAIEIFDQNQDKRMQAITRVEYAKVLAATDRASIALSVLAEAQPLTEELDNLDSDIELLRVLAEVNAADNNYQAAYETQQQLTDKIIEKNRSEQERQTQELKVKFDTDSQEAQNLLLQKENALQTSLLEQQQTEQVLLWLTLALATSVIAGTGYVLKKQIDVRKRFKLLALTDELTKAPNRRNIMKYAETQFELAQENDTALTISVIDLDHFKNINDQYGHDAGDETLIQFYQRIKQQLRSNDRIGRVGGEEWLLVMPGTTEQHAGDIFSRLQSAAAQIRVKGIPDDVTVTFSMGVAQLNNHIQELRDLFKRADKAVYEAKQLGRNRWHA